MRPAPRLDAQLLEVPPRSIRITTVPVSVTVVAGFGFLVTVAVAVGTTRRQPTAITELGHLLETFVVNEVLKQVSSLDERVACSHFRTRDGAEGDLVLETDDGAVIGIEVKASSLVTATDFFGLRSLR